MIGLVLQRSHIVAGDDAHYVATIQELEFRGARHPDLLRRPRLLQAGQRLLLRPAESRAAPGGRHRLPHGLCAGWRSAPGQKAIESLKKLNRPYMVALPLVFQTTQEWEQSDLGLHPVQVALQIAIPELDGAIEPIVLSVATMPPASPS